MKGWLQGWRRFTAELGEVPNDPAGLGAVEVELLGDYEVEDAWGVREYRPKATRLWVASEDVHGLVHMYRRARIAPPLDRVTTTGNVSARRVS